MFHFEVPTEKNRSYINTPNIFSRLILLKKYFENEKSVLIITENEKVVQNYLKISQYLYEQKIINKNICKLDNMTNIVDIVYNKTGLYIATSELFYRNVDMLDNPKNILKIERNQEIEIQEITKKLNELGYVFKEYESPGSFRVTGDTLSFSDVHGKSYKISFWGNTIEEITDTGRKENRESLYIGKNENLTPTLSLGGEGEKRRNFNTKLKENINNDDTLIILDSLDFLEAYDHIYEGLKHFINLPALSQNKPNEEDTHMQDLFIENIETLKEVLIKKEFSHKYVFTKNTTTFKNFLELNEVSGVRVFECHINNMKSFQTSPSPSLVRRGKSEEDATLFICDDNISRIFIKKRGKRSISKDMDLLLQIKPGDYIVHIDHGVGIFTQILSKELPSPTGRGVGGEVIKKEYVELKYKNDDKLFVPITEIGRLSKYVGVENPKLTPLSTKAWETKLKKASEDVEKIAKELLEVYAKRKIQKGYAFSSFPKEEAMFQKSFEFTYTPDQLHIIEEIFKDMESESPMDRLLSGDVGFGKTEIAFNAMYKAMLDGKQTALISPLVVLAYEHFEKAKERFQNFPFNIEVITRFEKEKQIKETLHKLESGKIDAIIGTHRLLSEDIQFKELGLLVVDEEHKFGVKDKEKIKNLKGNIDILSLSATPIPRSLNMALNGIKSISMLTTPPVGRQPIHTIVSNFSDKVIEDAGKREFERGGQLFFIHNRVETISHLEVYLQKIFPKKKIIITHGQLPGDTLEKRIIDFKNKRYDILLSTTVIENGIDFPNVNTIMIHEAGNFGISQIHQLRGRVGRSEKQGYCYLLFKKDKIKQDAAKRLKTIVDYSHLGAGFELAIKDLEVRGGGDILGIRQSGQSVEIGVNLFLQMLENKVEELKNAPQKPHPNPLLRGEGVKRGETKIDLNISIFIDDDFFSSELDKINFYREIESLSTMEDLENIISEFKDIKTPPNLPLSGEEQKEGNTSLLTRGDGGGLPKGTLNFFDLLRLKILASQHYICAIKKVGINYQIDFKIPPPTPHLKGEGSNKKTIENLKKFLDLDKEVYFRVISPTRVRCETKKFTNEESFLEYMIQLFSGTLTKKKIKLKMKETLKKGRI